MKGALRSGNLGVPRLRATCPPCTRPSCDVHVALSIFPTGRLPGEVLADPSHTLQPTVPSLRSEHVLLLQGP